MPQPMHLQILQHVLNLSWRQLRHACVLVDYVRNRDTYIHEMRLTPRTETRYEEAQQMHSIQDSVH